MKRSRNKQKEMSTAGVIIVIMKNESKAATANRDVYKSKRWLSGTLLKTCIVNPNSSKHRAHRHALEDSHDYVNETSSEAAAA